MKTAMSRFQIHDDLTAPEGSIPVLRGALASGGQLPNFLGVLAGSLMGARQLIGAGIRPLRLVFAGVIGLLAIEMIYNGVTGRMG